MRESVRGTFKYKLVCLQAGTGNVMREICKQYVSNVNLVVRSSDKPITRESCKREDPAER